MVQIGKHLALVAKSLAARGSRRARRQQFDRDLRRVFCVVPFGKVHAPHSAAAEFADNPIRADASPLCGRITVAAAQETVGRRRNRAADVVRLRVRGKQTLELCRERRIIGAALSDEGASPVGG